jgi:hypothetical protein
MREIHQPKSFSPLVWDNSRVEIRFDFYWAMKKYDHRKFKTTNMLVWILSWVGFNKVYSLSIFMGNNAFANQVFCFATHNTLICLFLCVILPVHHRTPVWLKSQLHHYRVVIHLLWKQSQNTMCSTLKNQSFSPAKMRWEMNCHLQVLFPCTIQPWMNCTCTKVVHQEPISYNSHTAA